MNNDTVMNTKIRNGTSNNKTQTDKVVAGKDKTTTDRRSQVNEGFTWNKTKNNARAAAQLGRLPLAPRACPGNTGIHSRWVLRAARMGRHRYPLCRWAGVAALSLPSTE